MPLKSQQNWNQFSFKSNLNPSKCLNASMLKKLKVFKFSSCEQNVHKNQTIEQISKFKLNFPIKLFAQDLDVEWTCPT